MQGAPRVRDLDAQEFIHHALHQAEQGRKEQRQQDGDCRAGDQRIVVGYRAEQRLDAERADQVKGHDQQGGDNVNERAPQNEARVGQVMGQRHIPDHNDGRQPQGIAQQGRAAQHEQIVNDEQHQDRKPVRKPVAVQGLAQLPPRTEQVADDAAHENQPAQNSPSQGQPVVL